MIQNASFQRKVLYLGLVALLLIPLYMIGHPAMGDPTTLNSSPGGTLAQLRAAHDLAPAELGEIDPASESMKLATLGMRGIAANILWYKATQYKKTEDWEKLVAAVNQISKLQPNFVSVWEFQSHNLSYNISVEHDDYHFRYLWVKKGIEFLTKGTRYNRREPKLFWTVGWYTGQKFGRADEHKQFRVLFQEDDDFHNTLSQYVPIDTEARGANGRPDNWLTSRLWYESAYRIVETQNVPIRGKAPHIFYSDGPKAWMNYAGAIESEGYLDERAERAWANGGREWREFGDRIVPSSWGNRFRLNDKEATLTEVKRLRGELDQLLPGLREQIRQEKIGQLTKLEREAFEKPFEQLVSEAEGMRKSEAEVKTQVSNMEVAERAPSELRGRALRIAKLLLDKEAEGYRIGIYRENVNFEYWRARCEVEQLPETVMARRHVYDAKRFKDDADLDAARREFESAWQLWGGILGEHADLVNQLTDEDLVEDVQAYVQLLGQLDEQLPKDFVLQDLLDKFRIPEYPEPATDPASATAEGPTGEATPTQPGSEGAAAPPAEPAVSPPPAEQPQASAASENPAPASGAAPDGAVEKQEKNNEA